ncbi:unnamed protein product [Angiostrongylus costaricensis]|uniref:EamA domain-containing protein n=1 Tax=Angiostrongylus costaricensis TaxID=334426 RepID=A0A0R3Q1A6_ANGCS|nr:unnamed protein product [Angiostrongylus costaricensis]
MTAARVAYAVTTISAGVITVMARLALFEHVPTSARAIVAMSFLFSTFFLISHNEVVKWTPLSEIYPNGIIIYPLGFTLLVAPFSLFIDNSSYLPINSSEIPAYSVPNRGYPMDQKPSDEPSEHLSVRMMQDACAAVELTAQSISMEKGG